MFDKVGFIAYVGEKAGPAYAAGVENIERLYGKDIDAEYEKDHCASLLAYLQERNNVEGMSASDLNELNAGISNLRRYIEYRDGGKPASMRIIDQLRDCLLDVAIGTKMKRQEIISLVVNRFGTNPNSIIPSDYCYNMTNKGISPDHISFFLNVGTGLYEYVGENYKATTIADVIAAYKKDFARVDDQERYKWEAIAHYKQHWDIDAPNFAAMYREAYRYAGEQYRRERDGKLDGGNLLTSSMYYPYKMIIEFAEADGELVRQMFRSLLDESIPLERRYMDFRASCDKCLEALRQRQPERGSKSLNHYQDLRAASVYLTFEYPEKYYLYKFRMYKGFRDLIEFKEEKDAGKSEVWKLENYNRMCNLVLKSIDADEELKEMSRARLDGNCYTDEAFHLLTMDVVYFGSYQTRDSFQSISAELYWPTLDEYDPKLSAEDWERYLIEIELPNHPDPMQMLKALLELGGEASCTRLSKIYGGHPSRYVGCTVSLGKRAKKYFDLPPCMDGEKERFFAIPFLGRNIRTAGEEQYSFMLRPELKAALEKMDLSGIDVYCTEEKVKMRETLTDVGLNTILYGPPGTGKTYHTVIYAVAIIENRPLHEVKAEPYDTVFERYAHYKADKLIEFTTFHQSYGYEEFIEGIKPNMEPGSEEQSDIEYKIEAGLFKEFCERASQPVTKRAFQNVGLNSLPTVWKVSLDGTGDNPVRTECLQNGHIRIGWDGYGETITDETDYAEKGKVVLNAFINKMKVGDLVCSCYSASTVDAIGVVTGEYEWHDEYDRLKRLRKVNWLVTGIREDITELNGATMTLASVYKLNIPAADIMALVLKNSRQSDVVEPNDKNYVFIIDEINRGNISKIFGELITLIEPSKRIGQVESATAKLPYSKKPFGVPDNVYLLGTMNTADRSIAAIDTALRRRFQFREMQPDPDVLSGVSVEDVSIKDLLIRMNQKISVLYDREHTIGHGYFMPLRDNPTIETLARIFENNIIPLLQEYFYDDYEKIRLVLGDNNKDNVDEQFIIAKSVDFEALFGSVDISIDDSTAYEINPSAFDNIDAYRSI